MECRTAPQVDSRRTFPKVDEKKLTTPKFRTQTFYRIGGSLTVWSVNLSMKSAYFASPILKARSN